MKKYFIKQYIINDVKPQEWLASDEVNKMLKNNYIIGFAFNTSKSNGLLQKVLLLNVYYISKKGYSGPECNIVVKSQIERSWYWFIAPSNEYKIVFHNPPIENWLDAKMEWCRKTANKIADKYSYSYDDALSEVYYWVCVCYNKGTVYMGSLNYIENCAFNGIGMIQRKARSQITQDNGFDCSLDLEFGDDNDGNSITLADVIEDSNDTTQSEVEYKLIKDKIVSILSKDFSSREIEQILKQKVTELPRTLQSRLYKWRTNHSIEEVL